jgi:hypothetical protein
MFASGTAVGQLLGVPVRGGPRPPVMSGPDSSLMTTTAAASYLGLAGRDSARI